MNSEGVSMWVWKVWMIMNIEGVSIVGMNSVNDYEHWGCEHSGYEQCEWLW
jgi:hypothetical protein